MVCMRQENYRLRSFRANQRQYVYISAYCSDIKQVLCNSRQGSTLSPLIFLVYMRQEILVYMRQENYRLRSFLANQKQYVSISAYCSDIKQVLCNSRQGSTLSPLIFLVYINNFQSIFSKPIVDKFADDNNLLLPSKKFGTIKSLMNHELKLLVQWLRSKKLFLLLLNRAVTELNIFKSPCKH